MGRVQWCCSQWVCCFRLHVLLSGGFRHSFTVIMVRISLDTILLQLIRFLFSAFVILQYLYQHHPYCNIFIAILAYCFPVVFGVDICFELREYCEGSESNDIGSPCRFLLDSRTFVAVPFTREHRISISRAWKRVETPRTSQGFQGAMDV